MGGPGLDAALLVKGLLSCLWCGIRCLVCGAVCGIMSLVCGAACGTMSLVCGAACGTKLLSEIMDFGKSSGMVQEVSLEFKKEFKK